MKKVFFLKLGLSLGLFFMLGLTTFAAAPAGTMTMTSQSIGTSATGQGLNTITVTSFTTEITAANDIFIRIPSSINARFDTTDTTVTIVQSGAGVTSTTVSYPVNDKTVKLNVTTNFDSGENVQIGGLTILGDAVTASTALVWAIDNTTEGSATFSSTSGAALTVTATDAAATLTMADATAGGNGTATLTLTLSVAMANTDTVTFTAPAFLDVSALSSTAVTGSLEGANSITCTASGQAVTCTINGASAAPAAGLTIIFPAGGIKGAYVDGGTTDITNLAINDTSATPAGADINSDSTVDVPAITVGDLTSTNVQPESLSIDTISPNTISFTTTGSIPNLGSIVIIYPAGWDPAGANSSTAQNLSGLDGTWTAVVSGQTLTLTQTGGGTTAAGAKSLVMNGIKTPSTEGSGGTYTIRTRHTASGLPSIEENTAVTADTMIGKTTPSIVIGTATNITVEDNIEGGVLITWDDPSGDNSKFISILKGTAPNPVNGTPYAQVDIGTEQYVDTNVNDGDEVTYVLRATDGNETGELSDSVTFTVGSGATVISEDTGTTDDTTTDDSTTDDTTTDDGTTDGGTTDQSTDDVIEITTLIDLSGHWSETEVTAMVELGVVMGNPDGTFEPDNNLNRAEGAALLYRVLGLEEPPMAPSEAPFSDVSTSIWYAGYVYALMNLDLLNGNPDGTYRPANDINRAEFLTLAMNVLYYLADEESKGIIEMYRTGAKTDAYVDLADDWYTANVTAATELEFVAGKDCEGGKCFDADASITRAEATAILYRMFGAYLEAAASGDPGAGMGE